MKNFPADARRDAGFQLHFVQAGQQPFDWKPMKTVGSGVREIRIHGNGEWRVIYVARFEDIVYVLHTFQKKTQKTRESDIEMARSRYKEVLVREKTKHKTKKHLS